MTAHHAIDTIASIVGIMSNPLPARWKNQPSMARFAGAYAMLAGTGVVEPPLATLKDVDLINTSIIAKTGGQLFAGRMSYVDATSARQLIFDPRAYASKRLLRGDYMMFDEDAGMRAGMTALFSMHHITGNVLVGGEFSRSASVWNRSSHHFRTEVTKLAHRMLNEMIPHISAFDFARELCWTVRISDGGLPVSFLTDATGVRASLKFRDLPPGKSRRDALVHWVSAHGRRSRSDNGDAAWVRKHLRGKWECLVGDLAISIAPPPDEVRAVAKDAP